MDTVWAGFLLMAFIYHNWQQGKGMYLQRTGTQLPQGAQVPYTSLLIWFVLATVYDIPSAFFIWTCFRVMDGSLLALAVGFVTWGVVTIIVLLMTQTWGLKGLVKRILESIADGWFLFSVVSFLQNWIIMQVPAVQLPPI